MVTWTDAAVVLADMVYRGRHRKTQVVAVQQVQDAVYAFQEASIQAKDMLWIALEVLLEGQLTVRIDVLGEYLCDARELIYEHRQDVAALHLHLMNCWYTPVAPGSQTQQ